MDAISGNHIYSFRSLASIPGVDHLYSYSYDSCFVIQIPFPHLPERLDMVKRLHRTREREIQEQSTEENEEDENSGTEKH